MADVQITEDKFTLPDGVLVYRKTWAPSAPAIAKLIFIHGFSDHINRYYDLFPSLASRGIYCQGIDQRGWGQSVTKKSEKGNTGPTPKVLADVAALLNTHLPSQIPVFLMGHSMGGGIALTMASTPEYKDLISQLSGILLESPYIALPAATAPSSFTVFAGRLAGKLMPHFQIVNEIPVVNIVHDVEVQQSVKDDPLCANTGTLEMFANMIDRGAQLASGSLKLNDGVRAIWLAHGDADKCTDYHASKEWFDREGVKVKDAEFKSYEGWSHQLHADSKEHRAVFAKDVGDWILERCPNKQQQYGHAEQSKL